MAYSFSASLGNTLAADILTAIGASGFLVIYEADGTTEVSTHALSATAGVVSGKVLTFNAIGDDTSATGGTASRFQVQTSGAAAVITGGVGSVTATGGGGDVTIANVTIPAAATVTVDSFVLTVD